MGRESSPGAKRTQGQASSTPMHLCRIISEHTHNTFYPSKKKGGGGGGGEPGNSLQASILLKERGGGGGGEPGNSLQA